ncbi:MAG: exodeoxyribonuclease VII large subunit [Rhodospirillaceae bacterium]|nr:exodeoxyribonuclease VII large subunit [Rhodospirillaceae bacterium]
MTDNLTDIEPENEAGDNRPILSVSEISQSLKRTVEDNFSHVRVRGEISRLTLARSGHMYLTLKDENAVLDGVCWRGTVNRLAVSPEDGMEVIVTGRLSTYAGRSSYQIVIEQMEVAGEGALLKMLEDRRKKLLAEGLFDEERKQPLPFLPDVIGVVTSPTGAVIRDILHRLADRFPRHVLLWPCNVQGEGADQQIAAGIEAFNRIPKDGPVPRPDLLIVARGGGSLEDLWSFNEEIVVRAAAASEIPLISAVGHETDTTLIDFASDQRAPTPTAAAEIAVPVRSDLMAGLADNGVRLQRAINRSLAEHTREIEGLSRGLPDPRRLAEDATQRLDERSERLLNAKGTYFDGLNSEIARLAGGLISPAQQIRAKQNELGANIRAWQRALTTFVDQKSHELDRFGIMLEGLSFQRVLDRGFTLVTDDQGQPVLSAAATEPGMAIGVQFSDGDIGAVVSDSGSAKPKKKKPIKKSAKKSSKKSDDDAQGSLL